MLGYSPNRDKYGKRLQSPYNNVPISRNPCKELDVHEMLKQEISGQKRDDDIAYRIHQSQTGRSEEGVTTRALAPHIRSGVDLDGKIRQGRGTTIPKPVTPFIPGPTDRNNIGVSDTYLYCDSFNKRDNSVPSEGLLIFDVQDLNNQVPIKNFIELEIILPFFIPEPDVDETYQPSFYFFRHLLIFIEAIGGRQFVNGGSGRIFHFDLELDNAGGNIFRAHDGLSKYVFTYPVRDAQELQIRFKTPLKNIELPQDVFDVTAVASVGPAPFNQRFVTSVPHTLTIGAQYSVYFKSFNSTTGALNSVINNKKGHIVDVTDSTTVQLTNTPGSNALGTAVDLNANPATSKMCVGERRIAFILRFRELKEDITNYIAP